MAKKQAGAVLPKLTEAEQDLIWHMEHGYQLETSVELQKSTVNPGGWGSEIRNAFVFLSWSAWHEGPHPAIVLPAARPYQKRTKSRQKYPFLR